MVNQSNTLVKGVTFALAACLIWGLIFVVPEIMNGFSAIEVALGRYFVYGVISATLFFHGKSHGKYQYPRIVWIKSLYFSLISTVSYYTFLVLALRYSSPAIVALILGISPITIAFYGNWKQKEVPFKQLILPSLLILLGLITINFPYLQEASEPSSFLLGLVFTLISLGSWSWYVVANTQFFKDYPSVHSSEWSTIIGTATLFWVLLFAVVLFIFFPEQLNIDKYFIFDKDLQGFLLGSAILGVFCSWVGAFLWNQASHYLPIALAGQLTVFETIFGATFVYITSHTFPSLTESCGIAILLTAVVYGIRKFSSIEGIPSAQPQEIGPQ